VEEDALRIFEVASCVKSMSTHPYVLKLQNVSGSGRADFYYTPDMFFVPNFLVCKWTGMLVEVKGDWLMELPKARASLLRTSRALRNHGVPFVVITETELRPDGLQDELKELLRLRPVGARRREGIDASAWDPLGKSEGTAKEMRRWRAAQAECNALLDRVMRRDPDEFLEFLAK
jgi:hypothetical protein